MKNKLSALAIFIAAFFTRVMLLLAQGDQIETHTTSSKTTTYTFLGMDQNTTIVVVAAAALF
jgi:hypothetical protein